MEAQTTTTAKIVGPKDGKAGNLGAVGARFMIWGEESGGGFSLVEHPIPPRSLRAPLHRHDGVAARGYVLDGCVARGPGGPASRGGAAGWGAGWARCWAMT